MQKVSDFPSLVGEVIACNPEFRSRYFRADHNRVLDKMLVVSEGFVDAIVNEPEVLPESEDNPYFDMDNEQSAETSVNITDRVNRCRHSPSSSRHQRNHPCGSESSLLARSLRQK